MHSTTGQVLLRKIRRLLLSPLVFWPTLQGALLAYWCHNGVWNTWDNIGWTLVAIGLGTAAIRASVGQQKLTLKAREDLRRKAKRVEQADLRRLKRRLAQARDSRLDAHLTRMTAAFERLQQVDRWRCEGNTRKGVEVEEIHDQACRLYIECRAMLERSQDLHDGANQMATKEIRSRVLQSREELMDELQTSLHHLNRALDEVYSARLSGTSRPAEEAMELRDELRRQVEVARQVETSPEQMWRVRFRCGVVILLASPIATRRTSHEHAYDLALASLLRTIDDNCGDGRG